MVKLVEFHDKKVEFPYDVADDLHYHMRNDKMFYRKEFLPTIVKIAADVKEEQGLEKLLDPMLEKAVDHYCKTYKIPTVAKQRIGQDVLAQVKERIMGEDIPSVQKGNQ